ncbi:MAG: hypothetical protein ABSF49_01835 [Roseiarcus sp.]|uniref:hypothetical protein n=1 Tax=Roseiarcus sp. TaxID=1969460 RepID=UPI003C1E08D7
MASVPREGATKERGRGSAMPIAWDDILTAFEFVSVGDSDNSAYLCRETGEMLWHSAFGGEFDELPDDIDDGAKYLALPDPRDLDLGKPLVMRFADEELADRYDEVAQIFSRRGAYRRFRDLLTREGVLDKWYAFEAAAKEKALREWCAENGVAVEG